MPRALVNLSLGSRVALGFGLDSRPQPKFGLRIQARERGDRIATVLLAEGVQRAELQVMTPLSKNSPRTGTPEAKVKGLDSPSALSEELPPLHPECSSASVR